MKEVERVLQQMRRYNNASSRTATCQTLEDREFAKLMEMIKVQPLGLHPAIDYHILNNENRDLTDAEFEKAYGHQAPLAWIENRNGGTVSNTPIGESNDTDTKDLH